MAKGSIGVGIADKPHGKLNSFQIVSPPHVDAAEAERVPPVAASPDSGILTQIFSALSECPECSHRVANALEGIYETLVRIADHLAPEPAEIVGTEYIAERLNCTAVWVAEMGRKGDIPKQCVIPGTGNGKVWKFHRRRVDEWLNNR